MTLADLRRTSLCTVLGYIISQQFLLEIYTMSMLLTLVLLQWELSSSLLWSLSAKVSALGSVLDHS